MKKKQNSLASAPQTFKTAANVYPSQITAKYQEGNYSFQNFYSLFFIF